jgi:hypothetical protein
MVGAFIAGALFGSTERGFWYGAFDTKELATEISQGKLALGMSWDDIPTLKAKAYSRRITQNGDEEQTAIYQDSAYVVLVNAINRRINRLGVWRCGYSEAVIYADANDEAGQAAPSNGG